MAFYYSATQSFDGRIAEVESELTRLNTMRQEYHRLFVALTLSTFVTTRPFMRA